MSNVLGCVDICKSYPQVGGELQILKNINFTVGYGETVSIVGSSGSGKSTLLHILSGLDKATSGESYIDNEKISNELDGKVCHIRNKKVGFIYQFHHLLGEFTALENVLMPILINGRVTDKDKKFACELLDELNLSKRISHMPSQLSGGERQRVAIARAVINNPKIVFADEPTGNLDNHTGSQVLEIFLKLQKELNTSVVIVTHDMSIAEKAQTRYRLLDTQLIKN